MGQGFSTAYGSKDVEGHAALMRWLEQHLQAGHDVRLQFFEADGWEYFVDDHDAVYEGGRG
jgi:hypothetical protein